MAACTTLACTRRRAKSLGVTFGDEVELSLTRDDSPRVLDMAPELEAAFATDPQLRSRFEAMSFTRRKEMSESIRTAVKPETRAARLAKALSTLRGVDDAQDSNVIERQALESSRSQGFRAQKFKLIEKVSSGTPLSVAKRTFATADVQSD